MRKVKNLMNVRDKKIREDVKTMIEEAEQISEDLSSYFYYHQERTPIIKKMLSESNQN